jgi:predicted permease
VRLLNLLRRRRTRLERDLDRELRYHLERRVADLMSDGRTEAEARRLAHRELGGVAQVQEAVRDTWRWGWLDALVRDGRYAIRSLARSWVFALGACSVLGLAIGANVTIFSVLHGILLRALPYPDAARIVSIETFWTNTGRTSPDVSGADFLDWQAQNDVFEKMAVLYGNSDTAVVVGGRPVFADDQYVSADFFAVFGQTAAAGRLLSAEDVPAADATPTSAVVAHHWAVTHFGSAEAAIGQSIAVYGTPMEIVGVAAPGFRYPLSTDIWAPWLTTAGSRNLHDYHAVGKLVAGVDLARAQAQMRAVGDALARRYPENRLKTVAVIPLQDRLTGHFRATLWVLMSAVAVVWVIACANIANLLLARSAGRTREIALRAALGAGRGRVVRQLLTESCALAGAAGLTGLLLAFMLLQGVAALSPAALPGLDDWRMEPAVLLFALGLTLASTVLFGLVPALHASRLDLSGALKGSGRATASKSTSRLRSVFTVAEIALSVVLLATAALLLRSFVALQHVDLGFTTDRVLIAYTEYAVNDLAEIRARSRAYAEVLERLRAVPGVTAASGAAYLGMGREPRAPRDYFIQGRPEGRSGERPQAEVQAITPGFFRTLEIPVLAGRDFAATDTPESPRVAVINETLARAAFPYGSPLGQRVRTGTGSGAPWMEIVGVVGDFRWQDPSRPAAPVLFVASTQDWGNSLSILVRTSMDESALAATVRALLHDANPAVPVRLETMEELFDGALAYPRFRAQVIGLFAGVAGLLAAVGIFSVLAYLVGQRTRELAVRRALGASAADVMRLVIGEGLRLVSIGLVLGLAGALAVARLLTGLLYQISPWDAGTYVATTLAIGGVALAATLLPAIRAAAIAPILALQQE